MEIGFEIVAAQTKKREHDDEPAQETMRGSRKIMSNPSTDQKKVRRSMTRKKAVHDPDADCDYCGEPGHTWHGHPEAHDDVAAWEGQVAREAEPFGRHVEAVGEPAPQHTTPEQRHPHGARPFPCKMCGGWGKDAYGQPCARCHGSGMTTTSALDEQSSKECRLCGGGLKGVGTNKARCEDCNTEHDIQPKHPPTEKAAFKSAIARRASLLNTPEEKA